VRSYFALESPPTLDGWASLAELVDSPSALVARVEITRAAVGAPDQRVAASIDFLGVVARVLSPALRSAVDTDIVPRLSLGAVWWRPAVPGPMRLSYRAVPAAPAAEFVPAVVSPVVAPLVAAYRASFALSAKVLWGDVASALNGAVLSLGRGTSFVRTVLSQPPLAGTARALPPTFVRNSCCLFYRVPGAGLCADCILR